VSSFKHRAVLFIGSESYDAPTITVLQGLHKLGWTIYTVGKPNINSWFCNRVVDAVAAEPVDYALSSLHWGTRWSLYRDSSLAEVARVLIDGDDSLPGETWRDRHTRYTNAYGPPPAGYEQKVLQERRWMEPLGGYEPDVLFTSQKQFGDTRSLYLPFGVHDEYLALAEDRPLELRPTDLLYVRGPGHDRTRMTRFLRIAELLRLTPGSTSITSPRGSEVVPPEIANLVATDAGVHGYYRWVYSRAYFEALGRAKALVYAPPAAVSWDSKRPWEAFAAGAFVLMLEPQVDMSGFSLVELCPEIVCKSMPSLLRRARRLLRTLDELDRLRRSCRTRVVETFSPEAVARYFLANVESALD